MDEEFLKKVQALANEAARMDLAGIDPAAQQHALIAGSLLVQAACHLDLASMAHARAISGM